MTSRPLLASLLVLAVFAQAASAAVTITLSGGQDADRDARVQAARKEVAALIGAQAQPQAGPDGAVRFSAPGWASGLSAQQRAEHVAALEKAWGPGVTFDEDRVAPSAARVQDVPSLSLGNAASAVSVVPGAAVAGRGEQAYDGAAAHSGSPAVSAAPSVKAPRAPSAAAPAALSKAQRSGVDLGAIDRSADPCQDFYRYACGSWVDRNAIPDDRTSWGRFSELQERNLSLLKDILEKAQRKTRRMAADDRKIGDYYAACMDEKGIEKKGAKAVAPELRRVGALSDLRGLPALLARLQLSGVDAFFGFGSEQDYQDASRMIAGVTQSGLSLPDRSYYLESQYAAKRKEYQAHVTKMFTLAGDAPKAAAAEAANVLAVETSLAQISMDRVSLRDPSKTNHKMDLASFEALTPSFGWSSYLRTLGAPRFSVLNVNTLPYFQRLDPVLAGTPVASLKSYLRWRVIHARAPLLSSAFVNEHFEFFGKNLTGQKAITPRWKRCVKQVDGALGDALGRDYVQRAFAGDSKKQALSMIGEIERAMNEDIRSSTWMSPVTQQKALEKLSLVVNRVGYPDKWKDYSALAVRRGDALGNDERASVFSSRRDLAKIGKAYDASEWGMTPPTVNAYYDPGMNGINFPAGILQPPFYDAKADDAVNFGGMGAVMGHELTHGFDDQGHQYDGKGNFHNWWTPADEAAFEKRAAGLVDEYSKFAVGDVHVNGKLTLGENTADNGGIRLAYSAFMSREAQQGGGRMLDGFTPSQRFFLGFGQIWCENQRPEAARLQTVTDPHTVNKYRVIGTLSNMPEFAQAFQCKAGDAMVTPNPARVW